MSATGRAAEETASPGRRRAVAEGTLLGLFASTALFLYSDLSYEAGTTFRWQPAAAGRETLKDAAESLRQLAQEHVHDPVPERGVVPAREVSISARSGAELHLLCLGESAHVADELCARVGSAASEAALGLAVLRSEPASIGLLGRQSVYVLAPSLLFGVGWVLLRRSMQRARQRRSGVDLSSPGRSSSPTLMHTVRVSSTSLGSRPEAASPRRPVSSTSSANDHGDSDIIDAEFTAQVPQAAIRAFTATELTATPPRALAASFDQPEVARARIGQSDRVSQSFHVGHVDHSAHEHPSLPAPADTVDFGPFVSGIQEAPRRREPGRIELKRHVLYHVRKGRWSADTRFLPASAVQQLAALRDELVVAPPAAGQCRVVRVASAVTGRELKPYFAAQLAWLLSEASQRRVLLVEADFDAPTLHRVLDVNVPRGFGLSEQLTHEPIDEAHEEAPITRIRLGDGLDAILEGSDATPSLCNSPQFSRLVDEERRSHDFIILNGPVVGEWPDAQALHGVVDHLVYVTPRMQDDDRLALESAAISFAGEAKVAVFEAESDAA